MSAFQTRDRREEAQELKDLLRFVKRPKTAAWRRELPRYSAAVMNWFVTRFERDISAASIFESNNPRQAYLVKDENFDDDSAAEFLAQLEAADFYTGYSGVDANNVVSIVIGYVFAQFIDPPLVIGSENKFGLLQECTAAVDVALKYAIWGSRQNMYDGVPSPDDLVRAFTDNVDANASPTVRVAKDIDSLFNALSSTGSRRPQLYFFLDEGGAWNALFVKNKNPTPVPVPLPEDLEDDFDMDAPEPEYEPGDAPGGVPRAGPRRTIGTRLEVWRGIARRTKGGLRKKDLMRNSKCKVVSKQASRSASKRYGAPEDGDVGPGAMAQWRADILANDRKFPYLNALVLRRSRMANF